MDGQTIGISKEFIATILGAIVGGSLSILASYLSVRLQYQNQLNERRKLIRDFVIEHAAYLKELADRVVLHHEQKNEVWVEFIFEIKTAYDVVVRNLEHLVWLDGAENRKLARKYFSDVYFISQRCLLFQNQIFELTKAKGAELKLAQAKDQGNQDAIRAAFVNMRGCVADLKNAAGTFYELDQRLRRH